MAVLKVMVGLGVRGLRWEQKLPQLSTKMDTDLPAMHPISVQRVCQRRKLQWLKDALPCLCDRHDQTFTSLPSMDLLVLFKATSP